MKTLLFASIAARAGFALFFMLFSIVGGARIAFLWWLLGISLSCGALWLLYGSPHHPGPHPVQGTIIYLVFGLSIACVWKGGAAYFNREIEPIALLLAGFGPGVVYYGVVLATASERFALPPVLLMMSYTLLRTALVFCNRLTSRLPSQWVVASALLTYALALAASGVLMGLSLNGPGADFQADDRYYALFVDQTASTLIYLGLISMTLEHAHSRLKTAAATDHLTGLVNRRGVQDQAVAMIESGRRARRPMAVLLADIDHFKQINDRYGHDAGDEVLQAFARRLEGVVQPNSGIIARWGGEEFLVVLQGKGGAAALGLARRLCQAMANEPVTVRKQAINVTVSIGVATFYEGEADLNAAVSRADKALYNTKRGGRNHARIAEEGQGDSAGAVQPPPFANVL